jgi:hypothetical protein
VKTSPKKTKKNKRLEDLPFFTEFVEPKEWKGKSTLKIVKELRKRAWERSFT